MLALVESGRGQCREIVCLGGEARCLAQAQVLVHARGRFAVKFARVVLELAGLRLAWAKLGYLASPDFEVLVAST